MKEICTISIFMNDEDVYSSNVVVDRHITPISDLSTRTIMEILAGLANKGGILDEIKKRKIDDNSPVVEMFIGLEFGKIISDLVELAKNDDGEIERDSESS